MSAKETEIWGRPLVKMTTKELRDVAKAVSEITGVHGMRKQELIDALRQSKGIAVVKAKQPDQSVKAIKEKIHSFRAMQATAREANERKQAAILRRRISRLKKKTRRAVL